MNHTQFFVQTNAGRPDTSLTRHLTIGCLFKSSLRCTLARVQCLYDEQEGVEVTAVLRLLPTHPSSHINVVCSVVR